MFGKLLPMFRRRRVNQSAQVTDGAPSSLVRYERAAYEVAPGNQDVVSGYVFVATLSPRTPLKVLQRHGTVAPCLPPPQERSDAADGIWLPRTKTRPELGLDLDELPAGTMASAIGQVPEDGGELLPFLIAFRRLVEGAGSPTQRATLAWKLIQGNVRWASFAVLLGWTGPDSLDEYVGYPEAVGCPGLTAKLAKAVYVAGFHSREAIRCADDRQLLAIRGIGAKLLTEIRRAST